MNKKHNDLRNLNMFDMDVSVVKHNETKPLFNKVEKKHTFKGL